MLGKIHQVMTGWLVVASIVCITVAVVFSRAPIRGASDEALTGNPILPIQISAEWSQEWSTPEGTIALLRGQCRLAQGGANYSADSMVIWAHNSDGGAVEAMTVYLEGNVRIDDANNSRADQTYWLELDATRGISLNVRGRATDRSGEEDPLFKRALQRRSGPARSKLLQTQVSVPSSGRIDTTWRTVASQTTVPIRRIRVSPRSFNSPFNVHTEPSNSMPPEQVTLITGGVNIVIESMENGSDQDFGIVDLSADRVVVWTDEFSENQIQTSEQKYQIYLEGHIVIRQSDFRRPLEPNRINAERAYFDARENRALVLDAEFETFSSELGTNVRMRAERIRQNSKKNFHAQNGWITTSQYGVPGYRLQSGDIFLENRDVGLFDQRPPQVNQATGEVIPQDHYWITALNSQFLVDQFPIFMTPRVTVPLEDITETIPIQGVTVGMDRVFGAQVKTSWEMFSLLGIPKPENPQVNMSLLLDYLSERGPAIGSRGDYRGTDDYGNPYMGALYGYYINDHGLDNLGFDRRTLIPADDNRGMFQWGHRYNLIDYRAALFGEIAFVSDRNFEEQYRERQFDTGKDLETKVQFNQNLTDNIAYTILGRTQLYNYENNTQWLPRGDLYFLGEPLLNNMVNYSSHSSVGYGVMNLAAPPTDPNDIATPLWYMANAEGIVAQTRHQFELPLDFNLVQVTPFVLGEAAGWGESVSGGSVGRLYGRGGVRASTIFERVFPNVQSDIYNLNGLAHKSQVEAEYAISGSTESLDNIWQWNEIDDNAQERFRMRYIQDTFGGNPLLPHTIFDPRYYAVRTGAGATVTAPYNELVANQQVLRLNWHQRLQTKVGPPDRQRIKDWMTLDAGVSVFPDPARDNFYAQAGLANGRYVWNVGDRTSIIANALYDFFPNGQQMWSVGVVSQRSLRGSVYVGLRQVKGGPLDSQIATTTFSYVLSPKWTVTGTTAFDIAQARSAGQGFTITRVGEWLLVHLGGNIDVSKNNVGVGLAIEPRLGRSMISSTQLGSLMGGQQRF